MTLLNKGLYRKFFHEAMGGCTRDVFKTEQRIPGYRQISIIRYFQSKLWITLIDEIVRKTFSMYTPLCKEDQPYYTARLFLLSSRSGLLLLL